MKIAIITGLYCFVMLLMSSLYNGGIMDPMEFLWGACYFLVGPVLLITSLFVLVRGFIRRSIRPAMIAATGFSIIAVVVWTRGYWQIGGLLRPLFFRLVASENERLAISFMKEHPPDADASIRGFHYPCFPLGETRVSHHGGSVYVMIPSAPGPKDSLVYVSADSARPEDLQHNTGRWYYYQAFEY